MRRLRVTTGHWLIAVAGSAVVFACFGVSVPVAMAIAAFVASALIVKPGRWQGWLILLTGAIAALPAFLLAHLYTFALRAALFLGHWPYYGHPDPKDLPDRSLRQSEFLQLVIPMIISVSVTSLFAFLVIRFARHQQFYYAVGMALALWAISYILLVLDPFGVLDWYVD